MSCGGDPWGSVQVPHTFNCQNIPSFSVSPGDKISLTDKLKKQLRITSSLASASEKGFPDWLDVNSKDISIVFKAYPARSDLPSTINEGAVVELYSK